ncbi:hypothetical protein QBC40DRAFT_291616 [Triangularia verruculosa]|uniref:Uncharacterized protein n=1 Tax=Triangularia verruculosa TaxID=2587418 RepID=A0AAN7B263_9PEZI|nr:hypothetical protein QBC40DRAFT_291616 [Triangularia verruculosa]
MTGQSMFASPMTPFNMTGPNVAQRNMTIPSMQHYIMATPTATPGIKHHKMATPMAMPTPPAFTPRPQSNLVLNRTNRMPGTHSAQPMSFPPVTQQTPGTHHQHQAGGLGFPPPVVQNPQPQSVASAPRNADIMVIEKHYYRFSSGEWFMVPTAPGVTTHIKIGGFHQASQDNVNALQAFCQMTLEIYGDGIPPGFLFCAWMSQAQNFARFERAWGSE